MESATVQCPGCNEQVEVTERKMLPPNEKHSESCESCGVQLTMWYDEDGTWKVTTG